MDKHNGAGIKAYLYGMCGILDFDLDDFSIEVKSEMAYGH